MNILELNDFGSWFLSEYKKRRNQSYFVFPLLLGITVFIGLARLGTSKSAIIIIVSLFPAFMARFYQNFIKAPKIIKNLIRKIEINQNEVKYFNQDSSFSTSKIKTKYEFKFFNINIIKYYILYYESEKYYLIPDFFDDFNVLEENINAKP